MKLKKLVTIALGVFLLTFVGTLVAGSFISSQDEITISNEQPIAQVPNNEYESQGTASDSSSDTSIAEPSTPVTPETNEASNANSTPNTSTNPSTPPNTPSSSATCGNGGTCTNAQVASHNSIGNCWVIISRKVYNVTSYAGSGEHRKSTSTFTNQTCGTDITNYFYGEKTLPGVGNNDHRNDPRAMSLISSYFIANLQ